MQLFDKKDFPVFHDILYKFSDSCDKYESLPYLNSYISDSLLRPNKVEYQHISNNLVSVLNTKVYKTNFPFIISRKSNNKLDYFIPMDIFYGLYCLVSDIEINKKTLSYIKVEAKLNNINFLQFSLNKSKGDYSKYRYFLSPINMSLNSFESDSNTTYCKIHIKELKNSL